MKAFITLFFTAIALAGFGQKAFYNSTFEKEAFQNEDYLALLVAADPSANIDKYNASLAEIDRIVEKLSKKQGKLNKEALLEKVFYSVHSKKLGWYEQYVNFNELIENKKYDCLTATALYAIILDRMAIEYAIYEFERHVLLLTEADGQVILFESTDPFHGFVNEDREISRMLSAPAVSSTLGPIGHLDKKWGRFHARINLTELAGLQYFNKAVKHHNQREHEKASIAIEKAHMLYPSERLKSTKDLIQQNASELLATE